MKELACIKHLLIKVVEITESSNQRLEVLEDKVEEALRRK